MVESFNADRSRKLEDQMFLCVVDFAAANPQAPIKELVVATMMATLRVFTALIDQEALSSGPTGATRAAQTLSQQLAFLQKELHEYVQMLPTEVVTADVPAVTH